MEPISPHLDCSWPTGRGESEALSVLSLSRDLRKPWALLPTCWVVHLPGRASACRPPTVWGHVTEPADASLLWGETMWKTASLCQPPAERDHVKEPSHSHQLRDREATQVEDWNHKQDQTLQTLIFFFYLYMLLDTYFHTQNNIFQPWSKDFTSTSSTSCNQF